VDFKVSRFCRSLEGIVEGTKCSLRRIHCRMISSLSLMAVILDSGEEEIDCFVETLKIVNSLLNDENLERAHRSNVPLSLDQCHLGISYESMNHRWVSGFRPSLRTAPCPLMSSSSSCSCRLVYTLWRMSTETLVVASLEH